MKLLGALSNFNDECGDKLVSDKHKGLDALYLQLKHDASPHVKKMNLWLLSNLAAGSQQQVSAMHKHVIMPEVVEIADTPGSIDVRREAFIILFNLISQN